jgi:hypothetical protein
MIVAEVEDERDESLGWGGRYPVSNPTGPYHM